MNVIMNEHYYFIALYSKKNSDEEQACYVFGQSDLGDFILVNDNICIFKEP